MFEGFLRVLKGNWACNVGLPVRMSHQMRPLPHYEHSVKRSCFVMTLICLEQGRLSRATLKARDSVLQLKRWLAQINLTHNGKLAGHVKGKSSMYEGCLGVSIIVQVASIVAPFGQNIFVGTVYRAKYTVIRY